MYVFEKKIKLFSTDQKVSDDKTFFTRNVPKMKDSLMLKKMFHGDKLRNYRFICKKNQHISIVGSLEHSEIPLYFLQ